MTIAPGSMLPFPREEHLSRQVRLRAALREKGQDAMLVFSQESLYWLTGYDTGGFVFFQCAVVTADERPIVLLTRRPDLFQARQTSTIEDIRIWWDADEGQWTGPDVPDFPITLAPGTTAPADATGPAALDGDDAFIMQADGKGWLFAPRGLVDGPLPTHYEPAESPVRNPLYAQQSSPTMETFSRPDNRFVDETALAVYPYVFTTYRLTEHHTAGGMSRFLPYLSELQPEMFCEISPALAAERGLENGGWATIISPRAAIETRVLVTDRVQPVTAGGKTVHQIGLPYHWAVGDEAVVTGDAANDLLGIVLDPNVQIQESKVGMCDIRPGRRPQGAAVLDLVADYLQRSGLNIDNEPKPTTKEA